MTTKEKEFKQSFELARTNTVIYHDKCRDGIGAAYAVHHGMKTINPDQEIEYIGSAPWKEPPNIKGKHVVIADLSYPYDKIKKMIEDAESLVILDHHVTAMEGLSAIDDKYKWFDMRHSGAYLAWAFFHRDDKPIPKLIKWIEAHDIWNQEYPQVKEFSAWWDQHYCIKKFPEDFKYYDKFLDDKYLQKQVDLLGSVLYRQITAMVESSINYASLKLYKVKGEIVHVASLNTTVLKSEIGHALMRKYPFVDMAMVYSYNDISDATYVSMRSTDQHMPTTVISTKFGGGGHRNASGFSLQGNHVKIPGVVLLDHNKFNNLLKIMYFTHETINGQNYSVVRVNTPFHQAKIGRYLLQTLYTDETSDVIRCNAIKYQHMILEGKKEDNGFPKKEELEYVLRRPIDIAILWNIDGLTSKVYSTVIPGKMSSDKLKALNELFKEDEQQYGGGWKTNKLDYK